MGISPSCYPRGYQNNLSTWAWEAHHPPTQADLQDDSSHPGERKPYRDKLQGELPKSRRSNCQKQERAWSSEESEKEKKTVKENQAEEKKIIITTVAAWKEKKHRSCKFIEGKDKTKEINKSRKKRKKICSCGKEKAWTMPLFLFLFSSFDFFFLLLTCVGFLLFFFFFGY